MRIKSKIIIATLFLTLSSCGTDKEDKSDPIPPEPTPLPQVSTSSVGHAISSLMVDIHNINLQGKTCGYFDFSTTCPTGGTVKMTGTMSCATSGASRTTSLNFNYSMVECSDVYGSLAITVTGEVKSTGSSTDVSSILTNESFTFQALDRAAIYVVGDKVSDYNEQCTFSVLLKQINASSSPTVSGSVCGKAFQ